MFNNIVIYHDVRIFFTSKIKKKKKMNSIKRCTQRVLIYRYLYETLNRLWRLTCEKCNMICAISHVKKKMQSKVKVHKIWANKEQIKMHTAGKLIASFLVEKIKCIHHYDNKMLLTLIFSWISFVQTKYLLINTCKKYWM